MMLRVLLIMLSLLLIVTGTVAGLLGSEAGSRWLLEQALTAAPGTASVDAIEGRLLDRIELAGLRYRSETQMVAVDRLVFDWNAIELLRGTLDIEDFTVHGIRVRLTESGKEEPSAPLQLPDRLALPVRIVVRNVLVTDVELAQNQASFRLDRLQLSARTEDDALILSLLKLDARPLAAEAQGRMALSQGFPLHLTLNWRDLQWPLTGARPQVRSERGALEVTGKLTDYRIKLTGSLAHPELPESALTFQGKGNPESMAIETLELKSKEGLLRLNGEVSWKEMTAFNVEAVLDRFNPAIVLPDLPGRVTLAARLHGKAGGETLELDAVLEQLTGQLRGHPLQGEGRLHLSGNRLDVDRLRLVSGANRLTAGGTLEPGQSDFRIDLDAPNLDQLWPGLGGSLKAQGHMQGGWQNPTVQFQVTGKHLLFEQHQAERLAVDIDYHPEANRASKLDLSAGVVRSGNLTISKLAVNGSGTQARHQLTATVLSSYGDVHAALAGGLKDATWRGSLSRLDLNSRDWGRWQLADHWNLVLTRRTAGIDANVGQGCLIRKEASLCAKGNYRAGGDFDTNLKLSEVPLALAQPVLPKGMAVSGHLNGDADVRRQRNVLAGRYQITLPSGSAITVQTEQAPQRFVLGASSLAGKIDGDTVTADLDLALPGRDYLRGNLRAKTGGKQALSGRVTASMVEFDWIKPFVPQLTDVKADLKADLTLAGTPAKPEIRGLVRLSDGAVGIAAYRIDAIEVEAVTDKPADRIRIRGSLKADGAPVTLAGAYDFNGDYQFALNAPAIPLKLAQPYLPEQLEIDGTIRADADVRQQKGAMKGQYRIEMPAGTRILVKTQPPAKPIVLGATVLTGTLDKQTISADLDMALAGKDFVRGQLRLATAAPKTVDGRLNASVAELALLDAFVPQLAHVKGRLHADLALRGNLETPVVQGSAGLANGAADIPELGLSLRKINLDAATADDRGRRLKIQGFAQSGQGVVNLDGFARLEPGWPVELTLTGEKFQAAKLPEAQVSVSPALKIAFGNGQGSVTGNVKVASADIELKELPAGSVKVSEDEIIVGREQSREKAAAPVDVRADVEVDLGKDTHFSGFGLETDLTGKLQIVQKDRKLRLHGNVDMQDATYKSYGQDLTVRKGRFVFNGPPDNPWLDVEAIRVPRDKKVTAVLALSGPAKNPQAKISSNPALPESEALAYLVTGRSMSQVSKGEGNMIAAAALSYGTGQMSWLADKLGIDEFEVKEGATLQDTLVAVGQYLNPDFYVGAKVGLFNNQAALVLKRKLTESLNVETEAGVSQRIKLNYEGDAD